VLLALRDPGDAAVIYFFRRAGDTRSCESRLQPDGHGYELVVTDGEKSRVETFDDVEALVRRQNELRQVWYAHGWRAPGSFDRRGGQDTE
jgi:hypothetical protein